MASVERWRAACGLAVWLAVGSAAPLALAHEFHVSSAEVEHNRESGKLEVALRVLPEDLEAALSRGRDRAVRLEVTAGVDALITAYLTHNFRVAGPGGEPRPVEWGRQGSLLPGGLALLRDPDR